MRRRRPHPDNFGRPVDIARISSARLRPLKPISVPVRILVTTVIVVAALQGGRWLPQPGVIYAL